MLYNGKADEFQAATSAAHGHWNDNEGARLDMMPAYSRLVPEKAQYTRWRTIPSPVSWAFKAKCNILSWRELIWFDHDSRRKAARDWIIQNKTKGVYKFYNISLT